METVACYAIAALLDVACVIKYANARPRLLQDIIKTDLATAVYGISGLFDDAACGHGEY
jgi:hypothetical protein